MPFSERREVMEERRRNLRTELEAELLMKRLDQQTGEKVAIHICDVSKTGIGFLCDEMLDRGAVYECFLTIWTKEVIHAFIEIVRVTEQNDTLHYGATFVGMSEMEAERIQVYQTVEQYKE